MMSSLANIPPGTNCIEFHVTSKTTQSNIGVEVLDISLNRDVFMNILGNMKNLTSQDIKHFQKSYKEYMVSDITCQVYSHNDEVKVSKKKALGLTVDDMHPNLYVVYSNKNKLTMLNFPSTTNIQAMSYVKTLIFRVNNRIYVNFNVSISAANPEQKSYSIFINYNHDDNVDISLTQTTLQRILNTIL